MRLKDKVKKDMYEWHILPNQNAMSIPFKESMIPENAIGFVYIMNMKDEKGKMRSYIGKKNFYSRRKKKFGKKKLAAMTDKRAKKYEIVKKLDYENYFSSNAEIKKAYKEGRQIYRTILKICFTKTELTYQEAKYQFMYEVLEKDWYLNGNILGRFYKGKI